MMKRRFDKRRERPVAKNCPFCAASTEPDYKDVGTLNKYVTERAKLLSRARTGLCAKHQRRITEAVKRARLVALLPFIVRA
ncbi:MAG: 30S ribosomal protein S18 [Candidatus Gottesmanbacteria bacterium]|nr:30S ribosomal protein S18 [Candidatus Gottesmanbacteria bacterium]